MTSDVNSKVNSYYKHMQKHFQSHGRTKEFVGHSSKVFISFAEVYFTNWTIIIFLVHFLVVKITTYFIFHLKILLILLILQKFQIMNTMIRRKGNIVQKHYHQCCWCDTKHSLIKVMNIYLTTFYFIFNQVHSVGWSCGGRYLASCSFDKTVSIFSFEKERLVRNIHYK